ncbi:MAG: cytochrome P450 [Actinomycetota bacterium]|nr:cytochrome P450 [Actinomycetota bacterium]
MPIIDFDPFADENTRDPFPTYQRLLAEAPVYHNPHRDFWAISRFEDVKAALMDWDTYSSAEGVRIDSLLELAGPSPLTMDPPRHRLLRNLLRKPFAPRGIYELEGTVDQVVGALLDELADEGEVDVVSCFAKRLPVTIICQLLGVPADQATLLKGWADAMLETVPGQEGSTPEALRGAEQLRNYWLAQLGDRRQAPRDDILTTIATTLVDGEPLSVDEQVGMCNLVFEAGNATTGTLIANSILALGTHRQQKDWLAANPHAINESIEELLRWESPVQTLMRVAKKPVTLHGVEIPAGARVLLVLGAANRDPRVWDSPDELRLERPLVRHLAFGDGIHHCLGAPLARLEAPIALRQFLTRYPGYEVTGVTRFHDVSMRTLKALSIRPRGGS